MPSERPSPVVYRAGRSVFDRLLAIEQEADALFLDVGIGPFTDDGSDSHLADAAVVFAVGTPPAGFASVGVVDHVAHLW